MFLLLKFGFRGCWLSIFGFPTFFGWFLRFNFTLVLKIKSLKDTRMIFFDLNSRISLFPTYFTILILIICKATIARERVCHCFIGVKWIKLLRILPAYHVRKKIRLEILMTVHVT